MIFLSPKGSTRASECIENNKRLFPIHSHFRKYSPLHFMKRAGAALVRTITSINFLIPKSRRVDCTVHWTNHYPLDNSIGFVSAYLVDSDLSA